MKPNPTPFGVVSLPVARTFLASVEKVALELGLEPPEAMFAVELARLVHPEAFDFDLAIFFLRLIQCEAEGGSALLCAESASFWERLRATEGFLGMHRTPRGTLVGFPRYHVSEQRIARRVVGMSEATAAFAIEEGHIASDLGGGNVLSDEQREAVHRAARGPFALISGGPGTGKTSIVVAVIRTLVNAGLAPSVITLAAPTGKAANRMDEAVRRTLEATEPGNRRFSELPAAQTLHRLLGFSPDSETFRHNEGHPLPCRVCIVDEGSMVDVALFERLLAALPSDASLIVLGDSDQLPSVEVGAVFRELAASSKLAGSVVRLTQSFRMRTTEAGAGRNVFCIADKVRRNALEDVFAPLSIFDSDPDLHVVKRASADHLAWQGVEQVSLGTARDLDALLEGWLTRSGIRPGRVQRSDDLEPATLFAPIEAQRILCFTRVGPWGSEAINDRLHNLYCARHGLSRHQSFVRGEPVMVTRNDYVRNIFNGDMGIVVETREGQQVAFPRYGERPLVLPLAHIEQHLEMAFAITTHKSQGSEFRGVLLVLPPDVGNATRELLYTALTRARSSVVLAGDPSVFLRVAVQRLERPNFLSAFLSSEKLRTFRHGPSRV